MSDEHTDLFEGIRVLLAARPNARVRITVVEIEGEGTSASGSAGSTSPSGSGPSGRLSPAFNIQGHGAIAKAAADLLAQEDPVKYQALQQLMLADTKQDRGGTDVDVYAQWPDKMKYAPGPDGALGRARKPDHYQDFPHDQGANENALPAASIGPGRLLAALDEWTDALRNETDPEKRGTALAFVLHLVGDIHQPLHCAGLVEPTLFPTGDEGGNKVWWDSSPTLHGLWDEALVKDATAVAGVIASITQKLDRQAYAADLAKKSFQEWAEGSYLKAVEAYEEFLAACAYIGPATRTKNGTTTNGQLYARPPAKYRRYAEGVALEQGTLATLRLCDLLKDVL